MSKRQTVLDQPEFEGNQSEMLRNVTERAEKAEAEVAALKAHQTTKSLAHPTQPVHESAGRVLETGDLQGGVDELRKDSMMAHLLSSLEAGKDIGHYGRLVFAMVARHFISRAEVIRALTQDSDFSEEQAVLMLGQVEEHDYNPPKRERLLEWQSQQTFPILPNPEDPDCGNLYRNLKFPEKIYDHISHYQEEKLHATDE